MSMSEHRKAVGLSPEQLEQANGGASVLGVYRPGFQHKRESLRFFRACVGDSVYVKAMSSAAGRAHHYVAARAFLSQSDWDKFVWIEEHGSLDGFPG